jgi:hypothetical protein
MRRVFEQQAKESAKAFAAFSLYLSLGSERSLGAVAQKVTKSSRLLKRWSSRWSWCERVRAYDENLAAIEQQATEAMATERAEERLKRQQAQLDEEWRNRNEALELARAAIGRWKANEKRCGSLEGIARLLELASKLGRLASGLATDKTEITGEDGGPIRLELEAALKKVYGAEVPPPIFVDVEAAALPPGDSNAPPEQRAKRLPDGKLKP